MTAGRPADTSQQSNRNIATMSTLQAAVEATASSAAGAFSAGYRSIVAPLAATIIPATFAPRSAQAAAAKTACAASSTSTSTVGSISTKLLEAWYSSVPQFMRFGTAASLGNIFFFAADVLIYKHVVTKLLPLEGEESAAASAPLEWLPDLFRRNRESVSFFLAYLVQISIQHLLNAWLVYGLDTISTREKYWSTLGGSYAAYATTLVASAIMNGYLLSLGWDKNVAFWGTICGFGVINYLLLTFVVTGEDVDGSKENGRGKANKIPRGGGSGGDPRAAFVDVERRRRRICFTSIDDLDSTRAMLPDADD